MQTVKELEAVFRQKWLGAASIADPTASLPTASQTMNFQTPTYTTTPSLSSSYNAAQLLNR